MSKSLVESIKTICENYLNNSNLSDVQYATITSIGKGCTLKLEKTGVNIPSTMVDVPAGLSKKNIKLTIDGIEYNATVDAQIKSGDRVIVLKKSGGQKYAIIGKV